MKKLMAIFAGLNLIEGIYITYNFILTPSPFMTWFKISIYVSFIILAVLFFLLAVGYILEKPWAWYLTFAQIVYSELLFQTSLSFLLVAFPLAMRSRLNYLLLGLELCKGLLFPLPSFKQYFNLESASHFQKRRYKLWMWGIMIFNLFFLVLDIIYILVNVRMSNFP